MMNFDCPSSLTKDTSCCGDPVILEMELWKVWTTCSPDNYGDADSWYFMGQILEKLGNVQKAKRAYSIAEEIRNEK